MSEGQIETLIRLSGFPREQVLTDVLEATVGRVEALEEKMAGTVPEADMTSSPFNPRNMEQAYIRSQEDTILRVIFDDLDKLKQGQAELRSQVASTICPVHDDPFQECKDITNIFHRLETIEKALVYVPMTVEPDIIQLDVNALKGDVKNIREQIKGFATQASLDFWENHFHTQFRDIDSTIRYMKGDVKRHNDAIHELQTKQADLFPTWVLIVLMFAMLVAGAGAGYALGVS